MAKLWWNITTAYDEEKKIMPVNVYWKFGKTCPIHFNVSLKYFELKSRSLK